MKFCRHCGKQLDDNAVCNCEEALKEQAENAAKQASVQQNQQENQTVAFENNQNQQFVQQPPVINQSPYKVEAASASSGDGNVVKALKNTPVIFMSFWKNLRQTINVAKKTKDIAVSVIYSVILFISVLLFNIFVPLSFDNLLKPLIGWSGASVLDFPKSLLVSVVITVLIGGCFTVILLLQEKIFNKNPDTKNAFVNSFVSFAILSIPASIGFILAGLCSFISAYLMIILLVFTIIYLIVALLNEIKNTIIVQITNDCKFILLNALFITIALFIIVFVCLWASGILGVASLLGSTMNSAMSGISSLGSLFG